MNFLAHSMISLELEKTIPNSRTLFGNFVGDFYKGRIENLAVASHIQDGVRLHRFIDSTTDRQENFLNPLLAKDFGRFKGIVSDIVIDHFIAKNFSGLFQLDLEQTEMEILETILQYQSIFPREFRSLLNWLSQNKALSHYAYLDFLTDRVFSGMAQRITRGEKLCLAGDVLKKHYAELEKLAIQEFLYTKDESIRKYQSYIALANIT
ncbi:MULTISPECIES: ACP phosphodiesterase [Rodentibacter]|uniref:ACP phosphodiesterase n=1 Tax=Rodentibacter TaxID=1960084 RepID=UPI001CFCB080|nr:ACP phosphodiesterase [Rodentibacter sp. JRC1]GJI55462.1 ACP phosphodiesterase [Rodentibacter sp. JRC1]